jgi:hypothetical protein
MEENMLIAIWFKHLIQLLWMICKFNGDVSYQGFPVVRNILFKRFYKHLRVHSFNNNDTKYLNQFTIAKNNNK